MENQRQHIELAERKEFIFYSGTKDEAEKTKLKENAKKVNPNITFFEVSATSGEGMEAWYGYLKSQL